MTFVFCVWHATCNRIRSVLLNNIPLLCNISLYVFVNCIVFVVFAPFIVRFNLNVAHMLGRAADRQSAGRCNVAVSWACLPHITYLPHSLPFNAQWLWLFCCCCRVVVVACWLAVLPSIFWLLLNEQILRIRFDSFVQCSVQHFALHSSSFSFYIV